MNKVLSRLKIDNNSFKGLLVHLVIMFSIVAILIALFFYIYLPITTHHGESVTVPDVIGRNVDELDEILSSRDLKYEVVDSIYTTKYPAFSVVKQFPEEGFQVKEGRKVTITLNRRTPELVKMPQLVGTSVKNAQMIAQGNNLKLQIKYVPSQYQNLVIRQLLNGKEIPEGSPIYQGTEILIEVGDQGQSSEFPIPEVVGLPLDDAKVSIQGQGLSVGSVIEEISTELEGTVIRQKPESGPNKMIRMGEALDLWIAKPQTEDSNTQDQ